MKLQRRDAALAYLGERRGTLEYRFLRYSAVADELERMGLNNGSLICDLGAGMGDFDFYLRAVRGYKGRYLPVDASIDGCDLNMWTPTIASFDFITAIELLEHLPKPEVLARQIVEYATKGAVVTTPNPDKVDVYAMDKTHVSAINTYRLTSMGFNVRVASFFGKQNDSLIGVYERAEQGRAAA